MKISINLTRITLEIWEGNNLEKKTGCKAHYIFNRPFNLLPNFLKKKKQGNKNTNTFYFPDSRGMTSVDNINF